MTPMTAYVEAKRYIDPDGTIEGGTLIAMRPQILQKFEWEVGARKGDLYGLFLLHQWFQKNAVRTLVNHQDKII